MPQRPPLHRPLYSAAPARPNNLDGGAQPQQAGRGSATRRGYDYTWQQLRKMILARDPLCVLCLPHRLTLSVQVDHIKTIRERPDLRLDESNLRGLCAPCHSRRTARDQRGIR